jgi:hypothetical protein
LRAFLSVESAGVRGNRGLFRARVATTRSARPRHILATLAPWVYVPRESVLGGTWEELFDELEERTTPPLDAGWRVVSTDRDESWEFGDSGFFDLEREGTVVELEYYEHGQLVAYTIGDAEQAEEVSEPSASRPGRSASTQAYTTRGRLASACSSDGREPHEVVR